MRKRKGKEPGALSVWKSKAAKAKGISKSTDHQLVKGALANVAALRNVKHGAGDAPAEREQVLGLLEAELHLLVPGVRGQPRQALVERPSPQVAQKGPPNTKRLLSQRQAATALGIGRPALTRLIATKQVNTTMVNGVSKVPVLEVERMCRSGWDVDAPIPSKGRKKSATNKSVAAEIMNLDL